MVTGGIFWLWFAVTIPAIVVEGLGVRAAMGRSKWLSRGNLNRLFVVTVLLGVVWLAGLYGVPRLTVALVERVPVEGSWIVEMSRRVVGMIWMIFVAPWSAAAYTLMYYDLRVRKEGGVSSAAAETGKE